MITPRQLSVNKSVSPVINLVKSLKGTEKAMVLRIITEVQSASRSARLYDADAREHVAAGERRRGWVSETAATQKRITCDNLIAALMDTYKAPPHMQNNWHADITSGEYDFSEV